MTATEPCALWYARYHSPDYALCDSEEDAARMGVAMMENGGCAVIGVQFSDGRTIPVDDWPAWDAAEEWRNAAEKEEAERRAREPKPVMRKIRDPFRGWPLEVEPTEPEWLGA